MGETGFRLDLIMKQEMGKRGWDEWDVVAETDLSFPTVRYCMNGERLPNVNTLELILSAFDMHLEAVHNEKVRT